MSNVDVFIGLSGVFRGNWGVDVYMNVCRCVDVYM